MLIVVPAPAPAPAPAPEATPDQLLLELMDLVALAFPEPLAHMRVDFEPAEDGSHPLLANLSGRARPGQPPRPHLGHGDHAVLAGINEAIADLADATARQGGVRVLDGRVEIDEDDDGAREVMLVRADPSGDVVVMTRRYDASELRWLLWTGALFARLNATADAEEAQRRTVDHLVRGRRRYRIDLQQGSICFAAAEGGVADELQVELLGSWSADTNRYLWGWANQEVPERLRRGVEQLRASSTAWGLRALTEASFGCPEPCAQRLVRHAAVALGARGVFCAPFSSSVGRGQLYLAIT